MSELHKFLFQGLPVRGMLVRLTDGWRELLARRDGEAAYPPPVRTLLGEMAAAGVLMQANIKFNGGRDGEAAYPPPVRTLLGEMAAAGVLMQANIKFNGALVLQVFGDGPVKLAVAEVQPALSFRTTAKVVGEVTEGARLEAMLNVHGKGRCAI